MSNIDQTINKVYTSWTGYPKLYNVGHPKVSTIFMNPVRIEEKIDGSQFSFGLIQGEVKCKSKNVEIERGEAHKLFSAACETVYDLNDRGMLVEGYTYRGEVLAGPKHNTIFYERPPTGNIILFDIAKGPEDYLTRENTEVEAKALGLEIVPVYFEGMVTSLDMLTELLATKKSILGGDVEIEGVVIKGDQFIHQDGKPMYAKLVSENFKEKHNKDWKLKNPNKGDVLQQLAHDLTTEARWLKSIQRMRDDGTLTESPTDIGPLIRAIQEDVKEECSDEIKQLLFKWAWESLARSVVKGFPQFYKSRLAESSFED